MALVVLDTDEAKFVRELMNANPEAESIAIDWQSRTNRVCVLIDGEAHVFDPEAVPS